MKNLLIALLFAGCAAAQYTPADPYNRNAPHKEYTLDNLPRLESQSGITKRGLAMTVYSNDGMPLMRVAPAFPHSRVILAPGYTYEQAILIILNAIRADQEYRLEHNRLAEEQLHECQDFALKVTNSLRKCTDDFSRSVSEWEVALDKLQHDLNPHGDGPPSMWRVVPTAPYDGDPAWRHLPK